MDGEVGNGGVLGAGGAAWMLDLGSWPKINDKLSDKFQGKTVPGQLGCKKYNKSGVSRPLQITPGK